MERFSQIALWIVVVLWAPLSLSAKPTLPFSESLAAIKQGKITQLSDIAHLKTYPLYPYLWQAILEKNVNSLGVHAIQAFINETHDLPTAPDLIRTWMSVQHKKNNWGAILALEIPEPDFSERCHRTIARYYHHGKDLRELKRGIPLVLEPKKLPNSCITLFDLLHKNGFLSESLLENRIKVLKHLPKINLKDDIQPYLTPTLKKLLTLSEEGKKHPERCLRELHRWPVHPFRSFVIAQIFRHFAKKDLKHAIEIWFVLNRQNLFSKNESTHAEKELAIQLARQQKPEALEWLNRIPASLEDAETTEWRVRAALRQNQWKIVKQTIEQAPNALRQESRWQFWLARAELELGRTHIAETLLHEVAKERNYYGFVASTYVRTPASIVFPNRKVNHYSVQEAKQAKWYQRMLTWKMLNRPKEGQREWSYAISKLSDERKAVFAKLLFESGNYHLAILTLAKHAKNGDLTYRFPLAYRHEVTRAASKFGIDPAWVLAITRQESAFKREAKSHQGALGLMQLMPGTARYIAKKVQYPYQGTQQLLEPQHNIMLGTAYINYLHRSFSSHPVLSTAAYNAGPARIAKWLPAQSMPVDQWIELIPYTETRDYVTNVMTYYGIYRHLLGQPVRFAEWLAPVEKKVSAKK